MALSTGTGMGSRAGDLSGSSAMAVATSSDCPGLTGGAGTRKRQ